MDENNKEKPEYSNTNKLIEDVQKVPTYLNFFEQVQKKISLSNVRIDNFETTLKKELKESGLETELRNTVYHWLQEKKNKEIPTVLPSQSPSSTSNTSSTTTTTNTNENVYLRKAQIQWDKRIHKSLQSMCSELGVHLAKLRANADKDEFMEKWNELSTFDIDVHQYRPVYAPKDFLEVILALRTNHKRKPNQPKWEFSHLPLKVKTLDKLKSLYSEFSNGEPLLGVNPYITSTSTYPTLEAERIALGEKVLLTNHAPIVQEYLKKGCPHSLRPKLWSIVLGAQVQEHHRVWYEGLKESVLQYDLMIDKLIVKDVNLTAANDDQYFVFEDVLFQIMLCFSRDSEILTQMCPKTQMQVVLKGKHTNDNNTLVFPPSGVIIFHGFTMYAAPFCYLYNNDPIQLYFTFRAFYLRYWYRLHRVCNHPQGIVSLCLLYERLLQCHEPTLWFHFKNNNIHPFSINQGYIVRVVFKWLMRAFSGHLPPEQLLYLWDLILAYDSLEILALLAVAIVSLRRANLMQVTTIVNIEAVLADLSSIAVMPLLQIVLLNDDKTNN